MRRATIACAPAPQKRRIAKQDGADLILHAGVHTVFSDPGATTMKYWILACSALAVVAAHAVYTFSTRQSRRRGQFTHDQVSNEWLATAKIHEDRN